VRAVQRIIQRLRNPTIMCRALEGNQDLSYLRFLLELHALNCSSYNRLDRWVVVELASVMAFKFRRVFTSSVGTKLLIGLTGLALFAYLVLHLAGNALIFLGQDTFNEYSHVLISNPLIIPIEIGLLLIFLLHVYKAVTMWIANQAARPVRYQKKARAGHTSRKSLASSTMIVTGAVMLFFILVHVKQFKYGAYYAAASNPAMRDLYRTEVDVFQRPLWVAFYVICTALVALHLRHGISSGFQSIGFDHPLYTRRVVAWGIIGAIIVGGGLAVIPLLVYLTT
jgi:succinate dehydrogenase / fumarate reductase cytochrome b subunit